MVEFGQFVIGGLGFGAIYALAALGLVLIFKTTGVVNFASGAMATVRWASSCSSRAWRA
jgi:branched-chain amino acid transport system permease protein